MDEQIWLEKLLYSLTPSYWHPNTGHWTSPTPSFTSSIHHCHPTPQHSSSQKLCAGNTMIEFSKHAIWIGRQEKKTGKLAIICKIDSHLTCKSPIVYSTSETSFSTTYTPLQIISIFGTHRTDISSSLVGARSVDIGAVAA